jgi:O-antigen/teichoic acid export membrane protein
MGIVRDGGYMVASNIILTITSLVTGIITARLLGPEGRGELYLVIQFATFASLFLTFGLGSSYQYHLSKKIFSHITIVAHMLVQLFVSIMLVSIIYYSIPEITSIFQWTKLERSVQFMASIAVMTNITILLSSFILVAMPHGVRLNSIISVIASLIYLIALLILVWLLDLGSIGAITAYILSLIARLVPIVSKIIKGIWSNLKIQWLGPSRVLFKYGLASFLSNLMISSVMRIDVFILGSMAGAGAVGIYSVAVAFAELALMIPSALGTSLFTHLPSSTLSDQRKIVSMSSRIIIFLTLFIGLVLVIISYPLVIMLMGDKYSDAVIPLCLLIPGLIAMSVNYVFSNYFAANGQPLLGAACFGCGLLVNIVLNIILIPVLKIEGAAIASSISYVIISIIFLATLKRQYGFNINELLLINNSDLNLIKVKISDIIKNFQQKRTK